MTIGAMWPLPDDASDFFFGTYLASDVIEFFRGMRRFQQFAHLRSDEISQWKISPCLPVIGRFAWTKH